MFGTPLLFLIPLWWMYFSASTVHFTLEPTSGFFRPRFFNAPPINIGCGFNFSVWKQKKCKTRSKNDWDVCTFEFLVVVCLFFMGSSKQPVHLWGGNPREKSVPVKTPRDWNVALTEIWCCCCLGLAPRAHLFKKSAWLLHPKWWQGVTCRTR